MFSCHEACTVVNTPSVAAHFAFCFLFLYVVDILYVVLMLGTASINDGEVSMLFRLLNKTITV